MLRKLGRRNLLPGFGLTLGYALVYLGVIVLLPLSALVMRTFGMGWASFWQAVTSPRVIASYKLTFGASLVAALFNAAAGFLIAWALVRYRFPGRKFFDAIVDLPFAMPTAVSGIALTAIYAPTGWLGQYLDPLGIRVAFTPLGVIVALVF